MGIERFGIYKNLILIPVVFRNRKNALRIIDLFSFAHNILRYLFDE